MQGLYIHALMCVHLSNKLCAKNGTYTSCNSTHQRDAAEAKNRCVTCTDTEPNEGDLKVIGRGAFLVSKMYVKS